jgi:hypothetical protein
MGNNMPINSIKDEAKQLIEKLPVGSCWEDLMHEIYVRQAIESGLQDSKAGNTISVEEVRKEFGLNP